MTNAIGRMFETVVRFLWKKSEHSQAAQRLYDQTILGKRQALAISTQAWSEFGHAAGNQCCRNNKGRVRGGLSI